MQVKPKLALLKKTLLGTGGALAVCAVLLVGLIQSGADSDGMYGEFSTCQSVLKFSIVLEIVQGKKMLLDLCICIAHL